MQRVPARRIWATAALLALPAPSAVAGEADGALTVTAIVLDRCAVAAQMDGAAGQAVRLSLHCPRQTGCVAGFGPFDGPLPVEAAGLERCRLDLRLRTAPMVIRTPTLFQVDF